ncbi:TetR/AcrR family transcriptional regulator [Rhizobium beringeri]
MVQKTNDLSPAGEFSRQSIIREARLLFSSGYSSASIDRILLKLNLTKGSFYHHFEDKKPCSRRLSQRFNRMLPRMQSSPAKGAESAEKGLTAICRSFYSQLQRGDVMRIICRDAGSILTSGRVRSDR